MMIPNQMMPSSFPPSNITTDQIQKFLDENKQLILAIMTNQNLGKLVECAQYQLLLQKNLMYLAAIADAQPPTSTPTPTISSQQGAGFFMQQASVIAQQLPGFPQQMSAIRFNNSPQVIQPQIGVRSGGPPSSAPNDAWRESTQDCDGKDGHSGAAGASDEAK